MSNPTLTKAEIPTITAIVKAAIDKHGGNRDAFIPILTEVNQVFGYIPGEAFREIRQQLNTLENQVFVSEGQLFAVASFYHMLSTRPMGQHVIRFCESAPCHVMGGRTLLPAVKEAVNLIPGETTPDKKWTLITTSCLGVCGVGPVLLVDDDIYGNVQPEQVRSILARYE